MFQEFDNNLERSLPKVTPNVPPPYIYTEGQNAVCLKIVPACLARFIPALALCFPIPKMTEDPSRNGLVKGENNGNVLG